MQCAYGSARDGRLSASFRSTKTSESSPDRRRRDGRIKAGHCSRRQIFRIIKPVLGDESKLRLIIGSQVDYVSLVLRDQNVGQSAKTSFTDVPKFVERGKHHVARLDVICIAARTELKGKLFQSVVFVHSAGMLPVGLIGLKH